MPTFPHPLYSQHVLQPAYHDAQMYLLAPMLAAHEAHALMLAECGIITQANAVALLQAVRQIRDQDPATLSYLPGVEDLFFRVEARIIELAGANDGGNLQLARSRNDLGQALARIAFRQPILTLYGELLALREVLLTQAHLHLDAIMPGEPFEFSYRLVARDPIRAQAPRSRVYSYYNPGVGQEAEPIEFRVD